MRLSLVEVALAGGVSALLAWVANDSLVAWCLLVLFAGLKLVGTGDRLFVLPAAFLFHWSQTSLGVLYKGILGREVPTIYYSDYRPMVLVGLGCCLALAVGIRLGLTLLKRPDPDGERPTFAFSAGLLASVYVVTIFFEGSLLLLSGEYPSLRQIIVTADTARLGLLYLLLRRLLIPEPRWSLFAAIVAVECVLGITGFFAGFREPVVLASLALFEVFDRDSARHWFALGTAAVLAAVLAVVWMGIRTQYRREYAQVDKFAESRSARLREVSALSSAFLGTDSDAIWETADKLVDRLWAVYYPALALERVPSVLPHTNGAFLSEALTHIVTPRVFFPGKPALQSDSEKVRRYSGVMVAGADQNTSIAFGYAAESYIDFGVPMMFLPVIGFGLALGCLYRFFERLVWHRELFVAFATVAFWLSAYLFERSWATMLGVTTGMMIYLGGPLILLDRFLLVRVARQQRDAEPLAFGSPSSL